jgi:hypothetical protein
MLLLCRFLLRRWRCRARTGLSLSGCTAAFSIADGTVISELHRHMTRISGGAH